MGKLFTVDLENGSQYEVEADYTIHVNNKVDSVGCSLHVKSVKPITRLDVAITDSLMDEIESALAYKIVDEYNDLDFIEDNHKSYLC